MEISTAVGFISSAFILGFVLGTWTAAKLLIDDDTR